MADVSWLEERADRIEAIFITHAHEDHIGALGHLWPRLKKRVYARRFTAAIGRLKFDELGLPTDVIQTVASRPETIEAGPFRVQFVPVAHSIPESAALIIDTPAGRIVHSGDFKLDPTPIVGEGWSEALFREIAAETPVKALMCDSTNANREGISPSEEEVSEGLRKIIENAEGRVAITTFSSNVGRIRSIAHAAHAAGREVLLLGSSMKRVVNVARDIGLMEGIKPFIAEDEYGYIPRDKVVVVLTGSQGEPRAALAKIARDEMMSRLERQSTAERLYFRDHLDDGRLSYLGRSLLAAGAACDAVRRVLAGEDASALCLVRPPGHHALRRRAMGFCLLGHVAVAARWALDKAGLDRALIVDWDVHHGNGTQDMFYDDPRIGYLSIHRWPFYPGTGAADETGAGSGLGFTRNLPIAFGTPRRDYLAAFADGLAKFAAHVKPQLVLVSAGFDAHAADPIGSLGLETEDFGELTRTVAEIACDHCQGRMVSVLEGGYNPPVLAETIAVHLEQLLR